jgi:hypothetical protein
VGPRIGQGDARSFLLETGAALRRKKQDRVNRSEIASSQP